MKLPPGFCAHAFATVPDARQLRFAPGGELFVASPKTGTTGGNPAGALGGIAVLPDDDHDGFADSANAFLQGTPSIQGLLFANGALYYQDGTTVRSVVYRAGDRQPSGTPQPLVTITAPQSVAHWPKVMDVARDGTLYVTNGGSQDDACLSTGPTRGAVLSFTQGATQLVAKGLRNPIALRCERDHDVCLAVELSRDYSTFAGGRNKLVPVRAGDDWGYPCCASKDRPFTGSTYGDGDGGVPDCSGVPAEPVSFAIGETPFGVDFEPGQWPSPWAGRAFVTLHGAAGSWNGARVVSIALDPATGLPFPATDLDGGAGASPILDFATGWDDGQNDHGRPAPIAFAADGRMFLGDDNKGLVVWIAPVGLAR
jgi:glucose/arabinose dehydrogenase